MSEHRPTDDGDILDAGIFTRLRPYAGWFLVATMIVGIAWAVLTEF
jgi:hypothetical protein